MRRTFFTMLALIISFACGVGATLLFRHSIPNQPLTQPNPIVVSKCPTASELLARARYVVISVPSDNEFYIGKNKVALSEITERVRSLTANESADERIVFIKGESNVKYSTISALISKVKDADVGRVELVPNKREF